MRESRVSVEDMWESYKEVIEPIEVAELRRMEGMSEVSLNDS